MLLRLLNYVWTLVTLIFGDGHYLELRQCRPQKFVLTFIYRFLLHSSSHLIRSSRTRVNSLGDILSPCITNLFILNLFRASQCLILAVDLSHMCIIKHEYWPSCQHCSSAIILLFQKAFDRLWTLKWLSCRMRHISRLALLSLKCLSSYWTHFGYSFVRSDLVLVNWDLLRIPLGSWQ